jgi:Icc-related predicted phosphoesterase
MKILTVSDRVEPALSTEVDAERFSGIDLVLSCGDLPPEYLSFLADALHAPCFYVRGNHDIRYESKPPLGCTDLHAKILRFQGIRLLGLEGSRWYNGGPQQYSEREMKGIIRGLRPKLWIGKGPDIVLTHAPPRHIHDEEDPCHRGFRSFRWLIDKYSPKYFIHGHIHALFTDPSQRITTVNRTKVINSYGYFILDIDSDATAPQGF